MQGFVDLRQNTDVGNTGGHFWPSFTDIMTVIVMIFMLASVVLVIKNWELLENLRQSMEAEREISESLRFKTEENATLEEQLAQAQHQLSMLRMQLMQAQEISEQQGQLIQTLKTENRQLDTALKAADQRVLNLDAQLRQSSEAYTSLQQDFQGQTVLVESLQSQVSGLETENRRQADRINAMTEEDSLNQQQLTALRGDYDALKQKYDKLVKPARTPKGKYVVEVRYRKLADDKYRIQFKDQGASKLETLSRKQLDERLSALKKAHPGKLYIKIIIPSDSGLSYAEAWKFMKSTLEKYDYYHQE